MEENNNSKVDIDALTEAIKEAAEKGALRIGRFNETLLTVQEYSKIAQTLMEKYPDLTPEEIGQKYDEELALRQENNKDEQEGRD